VFLHRLWQCRLIGDWRMSRAGVVFRAIGTLFQIGIAGLAAKPYGFWHSLFVSCIMSLVGLMVRLYLYLSLYFLPLFLLSFFPSFFFPS